DPVRPVTTTLAHLCRLVAALSIWRAGCRCHAGAADGYCAACGLVPGDDADDGDGDRRRLLVDPVTHHAAAVARLLLRRPGGLHLPALVNPLRQACLQGRGKDAA